MLAAVAKSVIGGIARPTVRASRLAPSVSALFSTAASTETPVASAVQQEKKRTKLKEPSKRAGSLLLQLEQEAVAKLSAGKDIDEFKPGDAVEVTYLLSRTSGKTQRVKGVVLARRNRGTGSSFIIRNHIGGYGYEQKIFLHSPLLQSVKVLTEAFIHKGKKRVRRAKLFYLRDKPPSLTTV
ncbi:hypothetical protein PINS_up013971 [Pythium insidiosum]|nr:hypothetical protein PINS_up013971 [Pythium insidiosum]